MNFYDVLAAEKWGGGVPTTNFFDLLFAQSISGGQWETYEGTLPATINTNGDDLRQYQVWGNTGGVGDRTVNEFDMSFYKGISGITVSGTKVTGTCDRFLNVRLSIPVELYGQELTWSAYIKRPDNPGTARVQTIDSGVYKYGNDITGEGRSTVRFTATSTIRLYINYGGTGTDTIELSDIMLTEGSTPPASYEPYGYKLDMGVKSGNLCPDTTVLSSVYNVSIKTGNLFNTLKNIKTDITHWISWSYKSNGSVGVSNQIRLFTSENVFVKLINNDSAFSLTAREITAFTKITAYFGVNNTNGVMTKFMLNVGSTALPYQPYSNTTIPIYIGDDPLDKDEYIDYQAGKIYRYETEIKKDVSQTGWQWDWEAGTDVTSQTTADNRVSVGRFYPEEAKEYIITAVPDTFEIAVISADSSDVKTADTGWGASWTLSGASAHSFCVTVRKSDNSDITPSEVDGVKFKVTSSLTPTDPPVTLPALPTVDGTTIVDYAGQSVAPEKVVFEYKKGGN